VRRAVASRRRRRFRQVLAFWPSSKRDGATALLAAEEQRRAARRLAGVMRSARIDLLVTIDDATLAVTTASAASRALFGCAPRATIGQSFLAW
jgi:hypothetical protein